MGVGNGRCGHFNASGSAPAGDCFAGAGGDVCGRVGRIKRSRLMDCERFCLILENICWSKSAFAEMVDVNERTVRRWSNGDDYIPERIAVWLEQIHSCHLDNPPPEKPEK